MAGHHGQAGAGEAGCVKIFLVCAGVDRSNAAVSLVFYLLSIHGCIDLTLLIFVNMLNHINATALGLLK